MIDLFVAYAQKDEALLEQLTEHLAPLRRAGVIGSWHTHRIGQGEEARRARGEEEQQLERAQIIVLLVSAHLLASSPGYDVVLERAMQRYAAGAAEVLVVLLRPVEGIASTPFGGLAPLPSNGRPVTSWSSRDDAWIDVVRGIRAAAERLGAAPGSARAPLSGAMASHRPIPAYPDHGTQVLGEQLDDAYARKRELERIQQDTSEVDHEILDLRRRLREGGQLKPGDALGNGRYRLLKQVGRGGFASVWRAHDSARGEIVAIKVLHSNLVGDRVRLERFRRGARRMQELQHEAVVRVLERDGEDGGWHYFVMEFLSGGDLRTAVLERRATREQILHALLRVGDALAVAHRRGWIHRDVKPANIVLDASGASKLTDFDLIGGPDTTGGTDTGALGTFVYAAPELMSGPQRATPRADVYGLGMTTLFALRGAELPMDVIRAPERFIDELDASYEIKEVLKHAVAWAEEDRYADAAAFCEALEVASEATIITAIPPGAERLIDADGPMSPRVRPTDLRGTVVMSMNEARLVVDRAPDGALPSKKIMLQKSPTLVGRHHTTDLRINDKAVSRIHARIELRGFSLFLIDTGSVNGTFVNGEQVKTPVLLRHGDRIQFGSNVGVRVDLDRAPAGHDAMGDILRVGTDGATGIPNRRYLDWALELEVLAARKARHRVALILVRVDWSSTAARPQDSPVLLSEIARMAAPLLPPGAVVGRSDFEELAIVLPGAAFRDASGIADSLEETSAGYPFLLRGDRIEVRLHTGFASLDFGASQTMNTAGAAELWSVASDQLGTSSTFTQNDHEA